MEEESEREAREVILGRLRDVHIYFKYLDSLFGIYREYNLRRKEISPFLEDELIVFGGSLYFLLYREAKRYNLLGKLDDRLKVQFWKYKTPDMDVIGSFSKWYDEPHDFFEDAEHARFKYQDVMRDIDARHPEYFDRILSILKPVPLQSVSSLRKNLIGLNFLNPEEKANGSLECRPQVTVKLRNGLPDDHIFESLLFANFEEIETSIYNFTTTKNPFVGESFISSMTQQVYPSERAWKEIDTHNLDADSIFKEMSEIFRRNQLAAVKFRQGYDRVCILRYIYAQSLEQGVEHISDSITPSNKLLTNKIFYFKSRLMRKLCSSSLIERASKLYLDAKRNSSEKASPEQTLLFMDLCIEAWKGFASKITY
jgi:hypothetical protein